ncbi:MAG: SpoIIIAH-like family protein [Bacillota bacterium]
MKPVKLNIRLRPALRLALLALIVAGLFWYVAAKRAEWQASTRPLTNMGDATPVLAPVAPPPQAAAPAPADEGFTLARLERDRARAVQEESLRSLAADQALPEDSRKDAASQLTALARRRALEAELEQLLRQKGFGEALVTLDDRAGRILISGQSELNARQLAQIADAARQVAGLRPWELSVVTRP